jgi:hypothetical protein
MATNGSITADGNAGKLTYQRSVERTGPSQRTFFPPTSRTQAQSSRLGKVRGSRSSRPSSHAFAWYTKCGASLWRRKRCELKEANARKVSPNNNSSTRYAEAHKRAAIPAPEPGGGAAPSIF